MATRQYIGARYVPKFYQNSVDGSTAWESNVVYEPLTYVTLINGHMYISKKEVPATIGTPATNIEYWLDIGSYNGFIDNLQNQINVMREEIAGLEKEVDDVIYHFPALHVALDGGGNELSNGAGSCCIVEYNDHFYMVDCFTPYQMTHYCLPYLSLLGVDHIDMVFISHYHGDHAGGLLPLIDSGITIGKVILPPAPDMSKMSFWIAAHDDVSPMYNDIIAKLNETDIPYAFADPTTIDLNDDLKMTALNTNVAPYYLMTTSRPTGGNTNESDEGVYADYNNMCTVYSFEVKGVYTYFLSDINYTAQENCKPYFQKAALIAIPHHDHDVFVDRDVMNVLNPDTAVAQNTFNEYAGDTIYLINRKCGKYLNAIGTKTLISFGDNIIIKVTADAGGQVMYGRNHNGYYDFMLTPEEVIEWKRSQSPMVATQYETLDCNTLEAGTTHRLGGNSTNTPIAGYGGMVTTFGGPDAKMQIAIVNYADGGGDENWKYLTFYRQTIGSNPYSDWQPFNEQGSGFVIPANSDLDDYTTPGIYYCKNGTEAATMDNTPITEAGFRLEVFRVAAGIRQRVTGNGNTIHYYERGNASMLGWGTWTTIV